MLQLRAYCECFICYHHIILEEFTQAVNFQASAEWYRFTSAEIFNYGSCWMIWHFKKFLFFRYERKQFKCLILLWSGYPSKLFQGSAFFILYSLYELPVLEGNRRKFMHESILSKILKYFLLKLIFLPGDDRMLRDCESCHY